MVPSTSSKVPCLIVDCGAKNLRIGTSDFGNPLYECLSFDKKEIYSIQELGTLDCTPYFEPIIQRGIITNWNFVERQIKNFITKHGIDSSKTPVIFTQSIAATEDDKEKAMHVLFEKLGFESICTVSDAYLSFVASGKRSGIVIQIGHSITQILPVINGEPMLQFATYFNVSGLDISTQLSSEINSFAFPSTNLPLKRDEFKEAHCYIPLDPWVELTKFNKYKRSDPPPVLLSRKSATNNAFKRIELQKIKNSSRIWFEIGEVWFNNDFAWIVGDVVSKLPLKFHDELYANIILSGGTVQMKGFKERFAHELQKKLPGAVVTFANEPEPSVYENVEEPSKAFNTSLAPFQGGVILANHPSFSKLLTKKTEYSPEKFRRNQMIRTSKRIKNAALLFSS